MMNQNLVYIMIGILIILYSIKLFNKKSINDSFTGSICDPNMINTYGKNNKMVQNLCDKIRKNILKNGLVFSVNGFIGNGKDTEYNAGNFTEYQLIGDQTISMFINPILNGRQNPIAKSFVSEGTLTLEPNGGLDYYFGSGTLKSYQGFNSKETIPFNKISHIAVVRDTQNRTVTWYINGIQTNNETWASNITNITKSSAPLLIGKGYVNNFKGLIQNLYMFNRTLSANEIMQLSKEPVTNKYSIMATTTPITTATTTPITTATTIPIWQQISGSLTNVSASGNGYVWGVNKNNNIYKCKKPCSGNWSQSDGSLVEVSGDQTDIWGVNSNNDIYKRPIDGSGSWQQVPGSLTNVSASGNGYVWGVNKNNNIYKCKKPCSGNWSQSDGSLVQVSGDQTDIWGVNKNNDIYKRPIDGSGSWQQVPGSLTNVSASNPNYIYGVNKQNDIYKCKKPCSGNWVKIDGSLVEISGSQNGIWGVNKNNNIYKMMNNNTNSSVTNNYTNVGNFDAQGNDLGRIPKTTVDNCKSSCDSDPQCVGFGYYNVSGDCYPKTNVSVRQADKNMNLYVKKKKYTNVGNYDASGNDLGAIPKTTVDYCKISCDGNPKCAGFAYHNPSGDCYPKTNVSVRQADKNMNVYVKENFSSQRQGNSLK